jgi:hypothetical protein
MVKKIAAIGTANQKFFRKFQITDNAKKVGTCHQATVTRFNLLEADGAVREPCGVTR